MKRIISIILIIAAFGLGYLGIQKLNNSGGSVEIGELELSAEDTGAKQQGYIYLGLCAACLIGGVVMLRKTA